LRWKRLNEALMEKVAEAIRQSAVMKMEEGEDLALYVANIWRAYARAALATIEAESDDAICPRCGWVMVERTVGSTRNETRTTEGGSR
jgi:hypothetical protein